MAGPIATIQITARRIFNALFPSQGPMEVSVAVDFSFATSQGLHLEPAFDTGEMDFIQTVWCDNSAAAATVFIKNEVNGQIIQYPKGSIGYQPFMCGKPPKVTVSCTDTSQTATQIKFINVPISALMTYNAANGGAGGISNLGNNVDTVAAVTTGLGGSDAYIYGYDAVNNVWSRARLKPSNVATADAVGNYTNTLVVSAALFAASQSAANLNPLISGGPIDGQAEETGLFVNAQNELYNGASFDRARNNIDTAALITLAAQAAGTVNSADQTNYNGRGVKVGINVTALSLVTIQTNIQGKDAASGTYYTIASTTAFGATGFLNLDVYPGITGVANSEINNVLPRAWRVQTVIVGAGTVSATVGASVIL